MPNQNLLQNAQLKDAEEVMEAERQRLESELHQVRKELNEKVKYFKNCI